MNNITHSTYQISRKKELSKLSIASSENGEWKPVFRFNRPENPTVERASEGRRKSDSYPGMDLHGVCILSLKQASRAHFLSHSPSSLYFSISQPGVTLNAIHIVWPIFEGKYSYVMVMFMYMYIISIKSNPSHIYTIPYIPSRRSFLTSPYFLWEGKGA